MNYSFLHATYQPVSVLAVGTLTFFGFLAVGLAIVRAMRLKLPAPWSTVFAALLGIQCVMLCVELTGMAGVATRPVLLTLAWGLLAMGCVEAMRHANALRLKSLRMDSPAAVAIGLVVAISLAAGLIIAIAPSTKIDELYYHMLAPARIAADGVLTFYREPWEAAIWPQMAFQIALTPLHALGVPDAGNVVGWWLGATLAAFAWRIIRDHGGDALWSFAWVAALCTGLYPIVWHVTAGSHAMGDLALCGAVVAWLLRESLLEQVGPRGFALLVSVLTLAAASSKVSLLPISVVLLAMTVAWMFARGRPTTRTVLLACAGPWVVFYLPILVWTAWASGSPFGPLLSGLFPHSVYNPEVVRQIFGDTRAANTVSASALAFTALTGYSPLVWLGVAGALFHPALARRERLYAAGLLAAQVLVIVWFVYPGVRFLGGLQYGLAIGFTALCATPMRPWISRAGGARLTGLALALLVPWLGAQLYYTAQFVPVSMGVQPREVFLERYVAFYRDFVALDRILPANAVILCLDFRIDAAYSPRPMFFDPADLPAGRNVYELTDATPASDSAPQPLRGFVRGESIYRDTHAVVETYRTPRRTPLVGPIDVVRLIPH